MSEKFHSDPRVREAEARHPGAALVFLNALAFCKARRGSTGAIHRLLGHDLTHWVSGGEGALPILVEVGLLLETVDGWQIEGYADWNPTEKPDPDGRTPGARRTAECRARKAAAAKPQGLTPATASAAAPPVSAGVRREPNSGTTNDVAQPVLDAPAVDVEMVVEAILDRDRVTNPTRPVAVTPAWRPAVQELITANGGSGQGVVAVVRWMSTYENPSTGFTFHRVRTPMSILKNWDDITADYGRAHAVVVGAPRPAGARAGVGDRLSGDRQAVVEADIRSGVASRMVTAADDAWAAAEARVRARLAAVPDAA